MAKTGYSLPALPQINDVILSINSFLSGGAHCEKRLSNSLKRVSKRWIDLQK